MRVKVNYTFLKMDFSSCLQLAENLSLQEVKNEVLSYLSQTFQSHASYLSRGIIELQDRDGAIESDDTLRSRLAQNSNFQAVFKVS